jgi:D-3-phosphoglycerate dehydrogenase
MSARRYDTLMTRMPKVVIPDDCPAVLGSSSALKELREFAEVERYDSLPGSEAALIDRIRDAEIVINIRSSSRFSATVFESCPKLKLVSLWGTGVDHVDLEQAARRGVTVTNTPGVSAASVAEHALALMLAAARNIPAHDAMVRAGKWPRGGGVELRGKTLGVIGLGAIGRRFAELAAGIGMRVLGWTLHPKPVAGVELVPFEQLLCESDVVSVHVRLSPETRGMISAREFARMKPTAIFVNTARGAIVDEQALLNALKEGRIAGAGLDVFTVEPLSPGHAFADLPNVVLTPHSAGVTPEALEAGLHMAVNNVKAFLNGRPEHVVVSSRWQ